LKAQHPNAHIHVEKLDVSDTKSIDSFLEVIKNKYKVIDVLVNNAGVAVKGDSFDLEGVKWTFQTVSIPIFRISMAPLS
jgi:NADP-dependent 3-hydroxy acid dehydrogenase YdfG